MFDNDEIQVPEEHIPYLEWAEWTDADGRIQMKVKKEYPPDHLFPWEGEEDREWEPYARLEVEVRRLGDDGDPELRIWDVTSRRAMRALEPHELGEWLVVQKTGQKKDTTYTAEAMA